MLNQSANIWKILWKCDSQILGEQSNEQVVIDHLRARKALYKTAMMLYGGKCSSVPSKDT